MDKGLLFISSIYILKWTISKRPTFVLWFREQFGFFSLYHQMFTLILLQCRTVNCKKDTYPSWIQMRLSWHTYIKWRKGTSHSSSPPHCMLNQHTSFLKMLCKPPLFGKKSPSQWGHLFPEHKRQSLLSPRYNGQGLQLKSALQKCGIPQNGQSRCFWNAAKPLAKS